MKSMKDFKLKKPMEQVEFLKNELYSKGYSACALCGKYVDIESLGGGCCELCNLPDKESFDHLELGSFWKSKKSFITFSV